MAKKDKRARATGRGGGGTERYTGIPYQCLEHRNYIALSDKAKCLLFELAFQYNGYNNGDLCITEKILRDRGWPSKTTLYRARDELESKGWIVTTRHGGRNICSLYALTYDYIHECGGKIECRPGPKLGFWKLGSNPWTERNKKAA